MERVPKWDFLLHPEPPEREHEPAVLSPRLQAILQEFFKSQSVPEQPEPPGSMIQFGAPDDDTLLANAESDAKWDFLLHPEPPEREHEPAVLSPRLRALLEEFHASEKRLEEFYASEQRQESE